MKKWIFLIAVLSSSLSMLAQTDLGAMGPSRVIPPNPEAARIATYGQYAVSPYTGKPSIEVPIYTIKTPRLQVPVSLNYEATGVKVDQLASWVGTGWVLNAGGMITRVVVGLPDEATGGYLSQTVSTTPPSDPNFYTNVCYYRNVETEPDKFFFTFNGKSGQFSYDASKHIFQTVASGLKIENFGSGFRITDEQGNTYDFTTAENATATVNGDNTYLPFSVSCWWLTKITSADGQDAINFTYEPDATQEEEYKSTYSAAYGPVFQMETIDADGNQMAVKSEGPLLDYSSAVMTREWYPVRLRSISFKNGRLDFNRINDRLDGGSSRLESVDIYNALKGVYTKQKSVKLLTDYFHYSGSYWNSQIYYTQTTGKYRLKLTGVENHDALGAVIGKYGFQYDESQELPFRGSLQQDYWGFFNGATVNDERHTLLPSMQTDDLLQTVGYADRTASEAAMRAGMLTKITYPTGGYSQFDWEAHRYIDNETENVTHSQGASCFGVNVPYNTATFTVTDYDSHAKINVDIRADGWPNAPHYANPDWDDSAEEVRPFVNLIENATGKSVFSFRLIYLPGTFQQDFALSLNPGSYTLIVENFINIPNDMTVSTVTWHDQARNTVTKLAGGLRIANIKNYNYDNVMAYQESYRYGDKETGYGNLSISPAYMNTLSYSKQFDYWWDGSHLIPGCNVSSLVRKLYKSEPVPSLALASGSSVTYPVVTKYYGDEERNAGKTIYHFLDAPEVGVVPEVPFEALGGSIVLNYPWRVPVVEHQEDYSNTASGYTLVRDTRNNYTELDLGFVEVMKYGFYNENIQLTCYPITLDLNKYYINSYSVNKGAMQLSSSTVMEYDPSGKLSRQTDKTFAYDDQYNYFLTNQTTTNSKNEVLKTVNKYPFNKSLIQGLSTTNSQAIDQLMAKNILAPVLESQSYRDANLIQSMRTNYRIWDDAQNVIQPENVQMQNGAGPLESRMSFGDYDAQGNLRQQARTGDYWTSYLWGYNTAYPIAEVKNATDADIAYTSFEEDGNGGWTYPGAVVSGAGLTGKQYYNLASGGCSKTGLTASTTYRLSYWSKGGAYTVSGSSSQQTGRTVNGWTYHEHLVTGVTTVSVTGGAEIDELRVYPANAQMTTYTYEPLYGMSSQCDINNKVSYYEYDTMGRLKDVKDQDGNVIKTIDYHYKGQ
jgi:hypothetical protein